MKKALKIQTMAALAACAAAFALTACGGSSESASADDAKYSLDTSDMPKVGDIDTDIDLDALNDSAAAIKDLDLDTNVSINGGEANASADTENTSAENDKDKTADAADEPKGEKTVYSYTDVTRAGNDLTVVPNGGLNASSVLYGGKDLNGFLDYVDSTVLEDGRTINRELFYDILAIMLVDKDLSSDINSIEKNMIMALAMANNFHDADIKIAECYLDANNAADYHYKLTAYGKDDTWIVNYGKRTVYMNNGATEYSSDMFKDEYLAIWMTAIEEYYGIK